MTTELVVSQHINDLWRMSQYFAVSGLFAFKTPEQAMALLLIADAEGRHPALAARDYDIIQNRPALKSVAILARFQQAGGTVKWLKYADDEVTGEFSHPQGGALRVTWDNARVAKAGLANKDNHKNYPAAMKRSRCIAEGVRSVYPACINGFMSTEEVIDLAPEDVSVSDAGQAQTKSERMAAKLPGPTPASDIQADLEVARKRREAQEAEPTSGNGHTPAQVTNSEEAEAAKKAARAKLEAPAERPSTGSGQAKPEPAKEAKPEPKDEGPITPDVLTRDEKIFVRGNAKGKPVTAKVAQMADFDMEDARNAAQADLDDPSSTREEKAHAMGVIALLEEEAARRAAKA